MASGTPGGRGNRVRACPTSSMSQSMLSRKLPELPNNVDCHKNSFLRSLGLDSFQIQNFFFQFGPDLANLKGNYVHNHCIIINAININKITIIIIMEMMKNSVIMSIVASRPPTGWANRVRAAQCDMTKTLLVSLHIHCKRIYNVI